MLSPSDAPVKGVSPGAVLPIHRPRYYVLWTPTGDEAVWTMEHRVRLQNDEIPGEVVDFTVIDHMDEWVGVGPLGTKGPRRRVPGNA
jgi:hypothetical protein